MSDPTILTEDTHSSSSLSDSIGSDIDATAKQPGMHRADTIAHSLQSYFLRSPSLKLSLIS